MDQFLEISQGNVWLTQDKSPCNEESEEARIWRTEGELEGSFRYLGQSRGKEQQENSFATEKIQASRGEAAAKFILQRK